VTPIREWPAMTASEIISPLVVAAVFILLCSLLREPNRQRFSALMISGAGAAYLGGGLGPWEVAFCVQLTAIAYGGLTRYWLIGIGWVLHTSWDVVHHLFAHPILPFLPLSSVGCAICDLGLATWYFAGAPSVWHREWRKTNPLGPAT
jgi:Family of unknown function (DUF6010)